MGQSSMQSQVRVPLHEHWPWARPCTSETPLHKEALTTPGTQASPLLPPGDHRPAAPRAAWPWWALSKLGWPARDKQMVHTHPSGPLPGDFALGQMEHLVASVKPDGLVGLRARTPAGGSSPSRQSCLTPSCPSHRRWHPLGNLTTVAH